MGTHPIFESDFDCLTDMILFSVLIVSVLGSSCNLKTCSSCYQIVTRNLGVSQHMMNACKKLLMARNCCEPYRSDSGALMRSGDCDRTRTETHCSADFSADDCEKCECSIDACEDILLPTIPGNATFGVQININHMEVKQVEATEAQTTAIMICMAVLCLIVLILVFVCYRQSRQKSSFKPDGEISLLTSLISTQAVHIADSANPSRLASPSVDHKRLSEVSTSPETSSAMASPTPTTRLLKNTSYQSP